MATLVIEDMRELIFPLFLVDSTATTVDMATREFLGTGFFVTKRADAITAMHLMPDASKLPPGKRVVAVVQRGAAEVVCWINRAAAFERCDLALIKVNLETSKYLDIDDSVVPFGSDVQVVGIPKHEVWNSGKEMRVLKGHVTLSADYLELNFPIPSGMSGSPVFLGTKVIAFAKGSVRSEETEDYTEEVKQISANKERIEITKTIRLIHYGLAYPLSKLRGWSSPVLDGLPLREFIAARNS